MRRQIRGLSQGVRNTQDGVSVCQVADGALAEVSEMLHRMTELSVQSANGTNSDFIVPSFSSISSNTKP